MKKTLLLLTLAFASQANANITFERIVPCSSHYIRTSGQFQLNGVNLKTLTQACSLDNALEHGKNVCESDSFGWLRPNGGLPLKFVKSTISNVSCKNSDGDFTCETPVLVECE